MTYRRNSVDSAFRSSVASQSRSVSSVWKRARDVTRTQSAASSVVAVSRLGSPVGESEIDYENSFDGTVLSDGLPFWSHDDFASLLPDPRGVSWRKVCPDGVSESAYWVRTC